MDNLLKYGDKLQLLMDYSTFYIQLAYAHFLFNIQLLSMWL